MVMGRSLFPMGKPKSERRAKIVSIPSPQAFRRSITELQKEGLSLPEFRSLVRAQNIAKAQLNRANLSMKERLEFAAIARMRIPKPTRR